MNILTQIIQILVGGLSEMATGLGKGLNDLVTNLFIQTATEGGSQTLTVFGTVVVVFAGVGLAIGLSRWVVNFITSLGSRNR